MRKRPFAAFDFFLFGHADFDQMADGGRQNVLVAFEEILLLGKAPQRFGDIVCDGRFFGDDEALAHEFQYFSRVFADGFTGPETGKRGQMIGRVGLLSQAQCQNVGQIRCEIKARLQCVRCFWVNASVDICRQAWMRSRRRAQVQSDAQ